MPHPALPRKALPVLSQPNPNPVLLTSSARVSIVTSILDSRWCPQTEWQVFLCTLFFCSEIPSIRPCLPPIILLREPRVSIRRLAFLVFLVFLSILCRPFFSALAGDEWQPIDPADLKMTSEPKAPGAPAIYLYRQVDRNDSGRAASEYNYVRIKILTEEGRKYANVEIPYLKQQAGISISNIRARAIRQDGTIVNFNGQIFDKTIEKTKGVKTLAKTFSIPDVQVGSIVEYHWNYDFSDNYVYNSYWVVSDELFTRVAKFSLKPYPEWYIRWTWPAGLPNGTDPPKQDPDKVARMVAKDVPAFVVEDYMPPENELKYRVLFIYSQESIEGDPAKFWRNFGKKQNDRLESFVSKRKDLEVAVSQIVSPSDSPDVKLRKIYDYVQHLRNLSYEPRKSQQEQKRDNQKKIENASDVLKNGYGSGFDLTWLFVGLARAAGFDASGAFVSTRNDYFFNDKRMNSSELNSNVAIVKVGSKEVYCDPGAAMVPYGMLPWYETAVKGLKLNKDGGVWVDSPLPDSSESVIKRAANLKVTDEGSLEGTVSLTYTGLEAIAPRGEFMNQDDEARKKYLEERLKDYIPAASEVDLIKPPDWKNSGTPFVAEFNVKIPGWVSGAGRRALLPAGIFSATEQHMFEHADRVNSVYFAYPFRKIDDVAIDLPLDWKVDSVPKDMDQDARAAEYALKIEQKSGVLRINRLIRSDLIMVPRTAYPSLRGFYQAVKSGDEQQIVLQPGASAAAN